jgi:hypothetical protein
VGFGTRHVRLPMHDLLMDAVAVLIAVVFVGLVLLLIKGIDRI